MPICSGQLKKAIMPKPMPPAAPAEGIDASFALPDTSERCFNPASSRAIMATFAPFCGPNTFAAPVSPSRGLSTSHMADMLTPLSAESSPL